MKIEQINELFARFAAQLLKMRWLTLGIFALVMIVSVIGMKRMVKETSFDDYFIEDDPMSVVSNLFDVAMVFALALMVALVSRYNMTEMFSQEDFTMVKNPGKDNMEIITKEGQKINRYTPSDDQSNADGTKGKRVGVAYELDNGEIIYVPE